MRLLLPVLLVGAALAIAVVVASWETAAQELAAVHAAEAAFAESGELWDKAMETTALSDLRAALRGFTGVLALVPGGADDDATSGFIHAFARWLAQPLRLRCLHRVAAAHELLRDDPVAVVAGHTALLREGYCEAVLAEATEATDADLRRQHEACLAPIARGMVLFAKSAAERDAAFASATARRNADGSPVLRWTTRWQMPDRYVPGLRSQPWWPELTAAATLSAEAEILSQEFAAVLASLDGAAAGAFTRRRADAWIPLPREGWGMLPLAAHCADAKRTCELVETLRGSADLSGTGYYLLAPGARLQAHSGPTNERCGEDDSYSFFPATSAYNITTYIWNIYMESDDHLPRQARDRHEEN
jgi:hypothetical protein